MTTENNSFDSESGLPEPGLHPTNEENQLERAELIALRAELRSLKRETWEHKVRRADLAARLKDRDDWIAHLRESPFWALVKFLWKLQRHFSRKRRAPEAATDVRRLIYGVDPPESSQPTDVLQISGWCFAHGGPQIVGVRAKVAAKSYFAQYGLERVDLPGVACEYPDAIHSGFCVTIPSPPSGAVVRLEAIALGGRWEYFSHCSTTAKWDNAFAPRAKAASRISLGPEGPALFPDLSPANLVSTLRPLMLQHNARAGDHTGPLFSIITPVFAFNPRWIAEAGASLLKQTFPHWEWRLVLRTELDGTARRSLDELASPYFHLLYCDTPDAAKALNTGLDAASGEAVCFLRLQDILSVEALETLAAQFTSDFDCVYSDEDKFNDSTGELVEPFFKPNWSPEYLRGVMYIGHLLAVRREFAARIRFDSAFNGIEEYEFMLRLSEAGARIGHVPSILYHSRRVRSGAKEQESSDLSMLQQKAVNKHLQRLDLPARAEAGYKPHRLTILPAKRANYPRVSIIIPTKDAPELLSACLSSLHRNTTYSNFETILVDNNTADPEALAVMQSFPVARLYLPDPFNFSNANNFAAKHATGEYLVFLNNDTEVISSSWIDHLLYYSGQADVGASGALLLHENGTVQHAGVVLGMNGTADHVMRGFSAKSDGYLGSLSCAREVSAVTAACLMIRKSLFEEIGGFNEEFATMYQDADLCLRLRERGLRIIWTPQAVLLHHESPTRQKYYDDNDRRLLLERWQAVIQRGDPYYNCNLSLARGDYNVKKVGAAAAVAS